MNFLAKHIQLLGFLLLTTFVAAAASLYFDVPGDLDKPRGSTAKSSTVYACPMHPEVQQDHLGQCPKCGMALTVASLETTVQNCGEQDSGCCAKPASTVMSLPPGHPPIEGWTATDATACPLRKD